jgi:large subunit ribosomal protein L32
MAVPKRRKSAARTRQHRASAWKIEVPGMSLCPRCSAAKLPHRVCGSCGWYAGRIAVEI